MLLRSGGSVLPSSTRSALARARGQITDTNTRDIMASSARLAQARVAGRGRLSPEAAQEYLTQSEADANRAAQEANVNLGAQEAGLELQETNTLRDRLAQARQLILGAGQFRQQQGNAAQLGSLALRLDRNKAIASTIASFAGMFGGGG